VKKNLSYLVDFTYMDLPNFDHKDIKIIAKRSNILQLSVFIYVFSKKRQILASQRGVFIISARIGIN